MNIKEAKQALDKIIDKARVHLYKHIQIAEILYQYRVKQEIQLTDLESYRNVSKKWRDIICLQFLGRTSTSSARYQDDIFNENAIPPYVLHILGQENNNKYGVVEAYIYQKFLQRFSKMSSALTYCDTHDKNNFKLEEFLGLFWHEAGLRRSIDKVYEIIVYALFSALVDALEISIEVSVHPEKLDILNEFEDFSKNIVQLSAEQTTTKFKAKINRMGVTNAADRGLDMWANFGLAIQIKHLSLTEELAENIVSSVSSDRIVIICKDAEQKIIVSLLNQIGWKSRIQSIITESDLLKWYEKALRGQYAITIGDKLLQNIIDEIVVEFPATNAKEFMAFYTSRGYDRLKDPYWE